VNSHPKIAFIHDWLTSFGGAEQVLAALLEVWPEAPVYTLVHDPDGPCAAFTRGHQIHTSFIQQLPAAKRRYRSFLPLMPLAIEQFDLRGYDCVVSISHAVAHGVLTLPDQLHINYICTPMRYAWHLHQQYLDDGGLRHGLRGGTARLILHYLRQWDVAAANRIDQFIAISDWVQSLVWRAYRRPAEVIYPPVDIDAFQLRAEKDDYYLTISRLVPYKKVDLIVNAFKAMTNKRLIVIGDGPELRRLQAQAGPNTEFLGFLPFESLKGRLEKARAFVYAAEEDFGIVPVEAQACGTPVIAYGRGGALETVIDGQTGVLFAEQNTESLIRAVEQFEQANQRLDVAVMRSNAERFSKARFQRQFIRSLTVQWEQFEQRKWKSGQIGGVKNETCNNDQTR